MLSRKVRSRFAVLIISLICAAIFVFVILKFLEENVVYFFSPTEINNKVDISFKKNIRIGALDLGNHILIIGLILIVIFVTLNVD